MSNLNDGKNKKEGFTCGDKLSNYKCNHCDFNTDLRISLSNHIWRPLKKKCRTIYTIRNYICLKCDFTTHSCLMLYQHVKRCTAPNDKNDHTLFKTFHKDEEIINKSAKAEESLKVPTTNKNFNYYGTDAEEMKLTECDNKTSELKSLDNGVIRWYKCDYCPFETMHERYLNDHVARAHRIHINKHTNPEEYSKQQTIINIINKQFCLQDHNYHKTVSEKMTLMWRDHKDNGLKHWHECDRCSFRTRHQHYLKAHVRRFHRKQGAKFKCGRCDYQATAVQSLTKHFVQTHSSEYNYNAHNTHNSDSWEKHFLVPHNQELGELDQYKCDHCSFKTLSTESLSRHISEHSNGCIICGYKSKGYDELRQHYLVHHPEELYKCSQCPFTTMHGHYLKSHTIHNHGSSHL